MNSTRPIGVYLFKKTTQDSKALKELLQFLRSSSPGKSHNFSYIEAETSLHPHLSLWENLQLEVGFSHSNDFQSSLKPEWSSLIKLIKRPSIQTDKAEIWEKFVVSLLKGLIIPTQNLLIDINENQLSPFLIQQFKSSILEATKEKNVFLASAESTLWIDCAHTLVERNEYKFETKSMEQDQIKKSRAS